MTAGRCVNTISKSWCTPHKYVNAIKRFWNGVINLDPCSNEYSVVGAEVEYCLPDHDGLKENWNYPRVFVNPPSGVDRERGLQLLHKILINFAKSSNNEIMGITSL